MKSEEFMLNPINLKTTTLTTLFNEDGYVNALLTTELVQMDKCVGAYIISEESDLKVLVNIKYLDTFENYTLKIKK